MGNQKMEKKYTEVWTENGEIQALQQEQTKTDMVLFAIYNLNKRELEALFQLVEAQVIINRDREWLDVLESKYGEVGKVKTVSRSDGYYSGPNMEKHRSRRER